MCEIVDREHMQIKHEHQELRRAISEGAVAERILEVATDLILTTLLHFGSRRARDGDKLKLRAGGSPATPRRADRQLGMPSPSTLNIGISKLRWNC